MWSLVPLIPVSVLAVSDFRHRSVSVVWLAAFGVATIGCSLLQYGIGTTLWRTGFNLALLIVLSSLIFGWLLLRKKKTGLHPKDYVGAGDLVFVLLLTPFFDLRDYLFFLLVGAVGSLLWWSIVTRLGRRPATIPLVGTLGTFLILHVVVELARG